MPTSEQSSRKAKEESEYILSPDQLLDAIAVTFQFVLKDPDDLQSSIITEQEMRRIAEGCDGAAVLAELRRLQDVCKETLGWHKHPRGFTDHQKGRRRDLNVGVFEYFSAIVKRARALLKEGKISGDEEEMKELAHLRKRFYERIKAPRSQARQLSNKSQEAIGEFPRDEDGNDDFGMAERVVDILPRYP